MPARLILKALFTSILRNRHGSGHVTRVTVQGPRYFFLLERGVCDNVLAAADFALAPVRPSLRVFEAADAALGCVCFFGALVCDNALADADFGSLPVDLEESVSDALVATGLLVTLLLDFLVMI